MPEKLFLIDAMAMIYRSYFALISNPLINSKGKNVSAVSGFLSSLVKILEEEKPDHIAVCCDTAKPTFRHKMFPQYKAQRQQIPDDMPWQIEMTKEVVRAMNIPLIEVDGYEADDIIGTLARQAEKEKAETYMVTPDKDYMQLVSAKIFVYRPARNVYGNKIAEKDIIGIEGVEKKFGVHPDKVIDVLGLMGDTSDNVPGVKGVGEKTATALIQQFGSIENMYNNIDDVTKPKLKENLLLNKEMALLSKHLVTIHTDVPLHINFHNLNKKEVNVDKVVELMAELEFKTLLKKIVKDKLPGTGADILKSVKETQGEDKEGAKTQEKGNRQIENYDSIKVNIEEKPKAIRTIKDVEHSYYTVKDEKEFKDFLKKLKDEVCISFDTETDGKDSMNCNIVGMSFSWREKEAYYIPILHNTKGEKSLFDSDKASQSTVGVDLQTAIEGVKPYLENKKIKKVGQNIKYDYMIMKNYGVEMENLYFDTLIGSFIFSPDGHHDMDTLSEKFLSYRPIPISALIGEGKDQISMDKVDVEKVSEYAAEDADVTLGLFHKIKYELQKINMYKLCEEIEFPLIKVLAEMEFEGVKIDPKILKELDKKADKMIKELEAGIYKEAGVNFNINSTKQLQSVLFEKLKLSAGRKTKTGYSTDSKVLEDLKYQHAIIPMILDYRMVTKIKSTYLLGLMAAVNPKTGRVHTSFNQCVAVTGRLSSLNPNLQNIPIRTEMGRSIRKAFVPKDSTFKILSADYSQIELRIMAHYANDENMIRAFKNNHDIHTETAMRIFKLKHKDEMTPNHRRKAKEVNFGIIYGIGAFGLANRLEIKNTEAKEIIDRYFTEYPKVKDYMESTKEFARTNGYVETLKGRRRYLKQINNQNASARAEDERAAINMPIQGTAADMIKIAMIDIQNEFEKKKLKSRMMLQVHDELVFEVKKDELETVKKIVADKMKNAIKLNVPIEVEIGIGDTWFDAH
ncbi:MAG: DNA polymerase I [Ignavibacteria bacterium]|nr:DNA polymerase I [Ignavibacteria bacterium]